MKHKTLITMTSMISRNTPTRRNSSINQLDEADKPIHDWYRFVLSYPPHLVREYLEKFGINRRQRVLDPFSGTGTTVVECKKHGIKSCGIEAHPMSHLAAATKSNWAVDPDHLLKHATSIAHEAQDLLDIDGLPDEACPIFQKNPGIDTGHHELRKLPDDQNALLLQNSISPRPLHKALTLLEVLNRRHDHAVHQHELLALAKTLVYTSSNLHFGPEVGIRHIKQDAAVVQPWLDNIQTMADDLKAVRDHGSTQSVVHHADARDSGKLIAKQSVHAIITSPPYPNEKDYTRTTRLESVLLGLIRDKAQLRAYKKALVRSNTRGVYVDDDDDHYIMHHQSIQDIAHNIEQRRLDMGKTSGFERMYHRVTKLYFGGMARHFQQMKHVLKPGAYLAYVVGDQASYLQVMIRTGQLLAEVAEHLGYEVVALDLFRTRIATATKEQLREEVLVLRWPGKSP